jgi:hypothetical protein
MRSRSNRSGERTTAISQRQTIIRQTVNHHSRKKVLIRVSSALALLLAWNGSTSSFTGQAQPIRRWNPLRAPAGGTFTGDQACAECHQSLVASQRQNSMWRAMETVAESPILKTYPALKFSVGQDAYEITRSSDQSFYAVPDGTGTISVPIHSVFGQGKAGQTYLLQYEGALYESRVSFYHSLKGLDFTVGSPRSAPQSLKEAFGRKIPADETLRCFGCHSTGAVSGGRLHTDRLTPGIRCEACHGPGAEHVAAGKAGQPNADKIFNPGRLSADELTQDFCATCHSGSDSVTTLRNAGSQINVRFQPYRIFNSKCYSNDRRISCTACHNPHEPLRQEMADYDANCLACHLSARPGSAEKVMSRDHAPFCKVATRNCASCHMPKIEPLGAHFKFTDHRIRIARPGEPYPF